jgi:hypothetical protein
LLEEYFPTGLGQSQPFEGCAFFREMKSLIFSVFLCLIQAGCSGVAGGGGSIQTAPDTTKSGEPTIIKLELTVWGSGGPIKGRYTDMLGYYRLAGEQRYKSIAPNLESQSEDREVYNFAIPAYAKGTIGEIEYHFELKFDSQPQRISGKKKIKLL